MAYRVHLLALAIPAEDARRLICEKFPSTDAAIFDDPEIFVSNESWSCLCVSTHSAKREEVESLLSEVPTRAIWITTNNPDAWTIRVRQGSDVLVDLHIPWICVDPDEREEADGEEVLEALERSVVPPALREQIAGTDEGSAAWDLFLKHAHVALRDALQQAGVDFQPAQLDAMFEADSYEDVEDTEGCQLGYFVNEVLKIGLDLSEADE